MIHSCRILVKSTQDELLGIESEDEWCDCKFPIYEVDYWFKKDDTIISINGDYITIDTDFKEFSKIMDKNQIKYVIE